MIFMKLKKIISFALALMLCAALCIPALADEVYKDEICATVSSGGTETGYSSFEEAWSKACEFGNSSEVTFTLRKSWRASGGSFGSGTGFSNGALSYSGAQMLTLDLNGYCIDRGLSTPVSRGEVICVNSRMTIVDSGSGRYTVSKLFKGGAIQNGASTNRGGGIIVMDKAELNFNGGTILNCVSTDDGGAISAFGSGAVLNVNGGAFYGNRTYDASGECCGGAIYSNAASVTVNNAVFEGNYAEDDGGAVYTYGGSLKLSSSEFYSNSCDELGGAVCLAGSATAEITECLFSLNSTAEDHGGAVCCDSGSGTYLKNCRMYYNSAAKNGGALYVNADRVFVVGGEYRYNTAAKNGGGIYVDSMNDINASGKLIVTDNSVNGKANDLCLQDGTASTAYLYCGGFYEGSSVLLCSTSTSSRLAIKGIDKFQYTNYIGFDEGFSQDKVISSELSQDNIRAVASAIGGGDIAYVCACAAVIIVFTVFIVRRGKKKREAGEYD